MREKAQESRTAFSKVETVRKREREIEIRTESLK